MTAKEKMTAPIASVGADVEQPLENLKTNQSIADLPGKGNLQATNNAENTAKSANKKNQDDLETVSMMELYDTAYPPKLPIIDGLLYNGTYLFVGSPKIGKSFFMAQIGYHISKGLPLWGFSVRQGTVSGFGLGVGSAVIIGALQEIYMKRKSINEDRLLLRPFPQGIEDNNTRQILWKKYREDMISRSGVSIFLFGNKLVDGEIVLANGVESEYKIALERHCLIVPVGCTGYMAEEIWEKVDSNMSDFYTNVDDVLIEAFKKLNSKSSKSELITNILSFIKLFENGKYSPR